MLWNKKSVHENLVGVFKYFLLFSIFPPFGEDVQFNSYFSNWLKPPTRNHAGELLICGAPGCPFGLSRL